MEQGVEEGKINDEISVLLLADLQEKQTAETNAVMKALEETDNAAIEKLKVHVRRSRRAGWMENLASIIFSDQRKKRKASEPTAEEVEQELQAEEESLKKEQEEELQRLEREMEEEKKKQLQGLTENEAQELMNKLNA